jgi:hypothetical protein
MGSGDAGIERIRQTAVRMSNEEPSIAEALDEPIVQSVAQRQEPLTAAVGQFIRGERGGGALATARATLSVPARRPCTSPSP